MKQGKLEIDTEVMTILEKNGKEKQRHIDVEEKEKQGFRKRQNNGKRQAKTLGQGN